MYLERNEYLPLFKKDDQSSVSNYRSLSLFNTIDIVMEKHIFNIFLDQHAITSLQFGYVIGDSTVYLKYVL